MVMSNDFRPGTGVVDELSPSAIYNFFIYHFFIYRLFIYHFMLFSFEFEFRSGHSKTKATMKASDIRLASIVARAQ